MVRNTLTNWWSAITAVQGVALVTLGIAGLLFGDGGTGGVIGATGTAVAGGLLLGGLALLGQRAVTGSRMIVVGAASTITSLFLIPVAAVIVIGGLWTGHLQLRKTSAGPDARRARPHPTDVTTKWYLWLVAAVVLYVVGLGVLVMAGDGQTATGEDDTSLLAGLAYFAWILSWLSAVISGGMGLFLGAKRGITRHRTRPV